MKLRWVKHNKMWSTIEWRPICSQHRLPWVKILGCVSAKNPGVSLKKILSLDIYRGYYTPVKGRGVYYTPDTPLTATYARYALFFCVRVAVSSNHGASLWWPVCQTGSPSGNCTGRSESRHPQLEGRSVGGCKLLLTICKQSLLSLNVTCGA